MDSTPSNDRVNQFLRLHARVEPRIHAYILSLLPNWSDAEDVLQETTTILWSKFDEFEPDSNFFAWACQIARFEVKRHIRRKGSGRLVFDDAFLDTVTEETIDMNDELEARQRALADCVAKLSPGDRRLVSLRYEHNARGEDVARELGRSIHMVYKSLKHIRKALAKCVEQRMAEENERKNK